MALSVIIPLAKLVLKASFHAIKPRHEESPDSGYSPSRFDYSQKCRSFFIMIIYYDVKISDFWNSLSHSFWKATQLLAPRFSNEIVNRP